MNGYRPECSDYCGDAFFPWEAPLLELDGALRTIDERYDRPKLSVIQCSPLFFDELERAFQVAFDQMSGGKVQNIKPLEYRGIPLEKAELPRRSFAIRMRPTL